MHTCTDPNIELYAGLVTIVVLLLEWYLGRTRFGSTLGLLVALVWGLIVLFVINVIAKFKGEKHE